MEQVSFHLIVTSVTSEILCFNNNILLLQFNYLMIAKFFETKQSIALQYMIRGVKPHRISIRFFEVVVLIAFYQASNYYAATLLLIFCIDQLN